MFSSQRASALYDAFTKLLREDGSIIWVHFLEAALFEESILRLMGRRFMSIWFHTLL